MDYFLLELIQQFISMCITVNETIRTPKQLTAINGILGIVVLNSLKVVKFCLY